MPRWGLWTVAAVVSWGIWAILAKAIGDDLTGGQSQWLSSTGIFPIVAILFLSLKKQSDGDPSRRGIGLALLAGSISGLGNVPYYDLFRRGGMAATAVSLTALYPIVTIALAVLFLRERVNRWQSLGLILALLAIYLFNVSEEGGLFSGWLAYALVPLAAWGLAAFLSKVATAFISDRVAAFWVLLGFLAANVPLAVVEGLPSTVSIRVGILTVALGFFLAFGNYAVVLAYAQGKASIITPLAGLYPVVSVPLAMALFGEQLNARAAAGILCSLLAVTLLARESPTRPSLDAEPGKTA